MFSNKSVFWIAFAVGVLLFGYDVHSIFAHGVNLDRNIPMLLPGAVFFFVWCMHKMDEVMIKKPQVIAEEDLPSNVTPIGRYLREADSVEAEAEKESQIVVPDDYALTKDGKYAVPAHALSRVDSDGVG